MIALLRTIMDAIIAVLTCFATSNREACTKCARVLVGNAPREPELTMKLDSGG